MGRRVQKLQIPGAAGALEARLDWPAGPPRAAALVCHPHPLHGGSMHTKAVARTARGLVDADVATLRFNFRGVGHSAGRFSGGEGEVDDAARALRRLLEMTETPRIFLGGFSFGSYVALRLGAQRARSMPVTGLLGIAPPLDLFDFSFLEASQVPLLLVAGDADPFCPSSSLDALQARLGRPAVLHVFPGAAHLLLERLPELEDAVRRFVRARLSPEVTDPP